MTRVRLYWPWCMSDYFELTGTEEIIRYIDTPPFHIQNLIIPGRQSFMWFNSQAHLITSNYSFLPEK